MKNSTVLTTERHKTKFFCLAAGLVLVGLAGASLFVGKYPLTIGGILGGDPMQNRIFWTLRFSRTLMGVAGGFCLGVTGFVYQTVFRNPLASPDIIGVASGASAGAAAGILFLSGAAAVTASAFAGAFAAVALALALSRLDRTGKNGTIVLAGIAVHALAQTALMALKLTADPERELASIEYWIMGSLNGVSIHNMGLFLGVSALCMGILMLLHRQVILLSGDQEEAQMLGVSVGRIRLAVLLTATLSVAATISLTGLVSFVGLLAPHGARLLTRHNRRSAMVLSGLIGGILLTGADILARSAGATELPVSIFTSLLGAPFLIWLLLGRVTCWK